MLRWKKRDDGFEWHQYVRTTIKLRRDARREKARRVGQQMAEGARAAGAAAEGVARSSLDRLGAWAQSGAGGLGRGAAAALARTGRAAMALAGIAGRGLAPAVDVLGRPGVAGPMTFVGLIASIAGVARAMLGTGGFDGEAITALSIGAVSLVLGLAPSLILGHGGLRRLPLAPVTGLPPRRWLIGAGAATAALVGSIVLAASPWRLSLAGSSVLPSLPFARSEPIVGRATVVAADMVQIGENKVRLAGIEVPDPRQRCTRPQPGRSSGRSWPCGEEAREALQRLVRGQQITCEAGGKDAGGTAHGRCRANDADLGEALVRAGLAFDDGGLMSSYRTVAEAAKAAKAGIWASLEPERPSAWRERIWADAKRKAPEGCPIKGRVKGGDRIYHLPGSTEYARIRVDKRRGERWFCTEAEAIAAGWRSGSPG